MPTSDYRRMEDYFDPRRNLKDRFAELSDASALPNCRDTKVNEAIMGFVVKYLCEYLRITSTDIRTIQDTVRQSVRRLEVEEVPDISRALLRGRMEGKSDAFGVQCLADVRATAALLKEIAFNEKFDQSDQFVGVDLGSGTGILGTGIAIAAVRQNTWKPLVALIDSQKNALENSVRVAEQIDRVDFRAFQFDLRSPETYQIFGLPIWVNYWVSETFGSTTPEITKLTARELHWGAGAEISSIISSAADPYMQVLENLLRYSPSFYERVKQGKTALFPNPINNNFQPSKEGGRIILETAPEQKPVSFRDIRNEFEAFEDFHVSNIRWR